LAGPNPVASQKPGEVQETELRKVNPAAVARSDQEVPFQVATWPSNPAARQNFADVHDTAVSSPPGTGCSTHTDPFHRSAPAPEALELAPTASQNFTVTHETPISLMRRPLTAEAGFAAFCSCHEVPFHRSARASVSTPVGSGP
jgi:hypothetical protein